MQYANLGNTGLMVSRLAFGAGSFGVGETLPGLTKNIDQPAADGIVASAIDAGINFFDTSNKYVNGQSEAILGRALGSRRREVVIASKCALPMGSGPLDRGLSVRHVIQACEDSLERLGTDWIDVYYAHISDPLTPLEETSRAFEHLVRSGKVRYIGVSNWPAWMMARLQGIEQLLAHTPLCAAQVYYSLVGRGIEREIVPFAQATGLGLTIYSPLAGGFLTGKYRSGEPAPKGSRRATFDVSPSIDLERSWPLLDILRAMAARHGATPAHIAYRWALHKPYVTSVVFGVSKPEQFHDNIKAMETELSADELKILDDASAHAI